MPDTRFTLYFDDTISELEANKSDIPACLMVIECQRGFLFGFNKFRQHWEIPGGRREDGETLVECAKRELWEEAGQEVEEATFSGLIKMRVGGIGVTSAAIYYSKIEDVQFNDLVNEWTSLRLHDLRDLRNPKEIVDNVGVDVVCHLVRAGITGNSDIPSSLDPKQ